MANQDPKNTINGSQLEQADKPRIIVVCGPTGIGKTSVAIELAGEVGGEIVSADSMQLYRMMNIGTATPNAAEQAAVRHHLVERAGILHPTERRLAHDDLVEGAPEAVDIRSNIDRVRVGHLFGSHVIGGSHRLTGGCQFDV